jgi:hypothetical protein
MCTWYWHYLRHAGTASLTRTAPMPHAAANPSKHQHLHALHYHKPPISTQLTFSSQLLPATWFARSARASVTRLRLRSTALRRHNSTAAGTLPVLMLRTAGTAGMHCAQLSAAAALNVLHFVLHPG